MSVSHYTPYNKNNYFEIGDKQVKIDGFHRIELCVDRR